MDKIVAVVEIPGGDCLSTFLSRRELAVDGARWGIWPATFNKGGDISGEETLV
jgi:hypothetical protein